MDFVSAVPDLASFPRARLGVGGPRGVPQRPTAAFAYGDPRGSRACCATVLAGYLAGSAAPDADPERVVVCTGFAQGLDLVLRAWPGSGVRRVAFEDPGYDETSAYATASPGRGGAGAGRRVGHRRGRAGRSDVQAVVLTPAHQWPTGVVLAPERRHALVRVGAPTATPSIVEDDYDAEFRYDREPVGAVQGLAPDRVVALGTVSKSLAPTLRLGWILCPAGMVDAVAEEKQRADRGSPGLDQMASRH